MSWCTISLNGGYQANGPWWIIEHDEGKTSIVPAYNYVYKWDNAFEMDLLHYVKLQLIDPVAVIHSKRIYEGVCYKNSPFDLWKVYVEATE